MTSRELADAIDELIVLRIKNMNAGDSQTAKWTGEEIELVKRQIADAFKRLDHTGGMYVVGKDACGKDQT